MRLAPRPRTALLRTLAGGFIYYMIAISWLMTLGRFFPIVVVGIVIAALYLTLYPALSAFALRRWFSSLPVWGHFAAFAAVWLVAERARTLGELAVPMVQVGHAWAPWPRVVQMAEFFGEAGINAQVLLVSAGLLALIQLVAAAWGVSPAPASGEPGAEDLLLGGPRPLPLRAGLAGALLGAAALLFLLSSYRFYLWSGWLEATPADQKLRVALVQPNISQEEKVQSVAAEDERERDRLVESHTVILEELTTAEVTPEVDLVIFPESAYTDLLFSLDRFTRARVRRMMAASGADLLTGGTRVGLDEKMERIERVWNSAWFVPANGGAWQSYDKIRLVPFGENLSYFRYLPFIGTMVAVGEFDRGKEMTVFRTHGAAFSTLICFESYFGSQTRLAARNGAEFIVIITNDGWYGRSAGPAQHHAQSILRAIETRRPIARCAYTGISSIFDPSGRRTAGLGLEERGVVLGELAPQRGVTFFVRWGNVWLIGASALLVVALAFLNRRTGRPPSTVAAEASRQV